MKYIDLIVFFCEKNNLDVESIPKAVSKTQGGGNRSRVIIRIEPIEEKLLCPNFHYDSQSETLRCL